MDDNKKDGYVAGGVLFVIGLIVLSSSWNQIITGDKTMAIIGGVLSLLGIGSILNPSIAEIVVHWIKGLQKAEETKISQRQHKPVNSPQVGNVHGDVKVIYGQDSKEESSPSKVKKDKVIARLEEIKNKLSEIRNKTYKIGSPDLHKYQGEVTMIIRRVYPKNAKEVQHTLIPVYAMFAHDDYFQHQKDFLRDVDDLINATETITKDIELEQD